MPQHAKKLAPKPTALQKQMLFLFYWTLLTQAYVLEYKYDENDPWQKLGMPLGQAAYFDDNFDI